MSASPQLEDGMTPIANELIEAYCKINMSAYEWRILLFIARKTFGYHKKTDRISYSQFAEGTGINHRHIGRTLKLLVDRQIITCSGTGYLLEYGIQKDYDLWKNIRHSHAILAPNGVLKISTKRGTDLAPNGVLIEKENQYLTGAESVPIGVNSTPIGVPKSVPNGAHTKERKVITKENLQNKYEIPEWIDRQIFESFIEMRKKLKKPLTDYAIYLAIKKLETFKDNGEDPNEILNRAILGSWQGLYSLKDRGGNHGITQRRTTEIRTGDKANVGGGKTPGAYQASIAKYGGS